MRINSAAAIALAKSLYAKHGSWRAVRRALAASADTQPEAGDVQQAPLVSGAVPNGETPR